MLNYRCYAQSHDHLHNSNFSVLLCFVSAYVYIGIDAEIEIQNLKSFVVLIDREQIYNVTREGPRPGARVEQVWEIQDDLISEILSQIPKLEEMTFYGFQGASNIAAPTSKYYYQFSGILSGGIRYIHINAVFNDEEIDYLKKGTGLRKAS